jgi:2-phosphosulfolactate phosphatase
MVIQIYSSSRAITKMKGVVVVIDVLRAFTTTCYLFANGAKRVISVAGLRDAYAVKKNHPSYILIGERKGIKPPDFDYGNSPAEIKNVSFHNKTVIFTTSAGTQGIRKAIHSDEVITGAFVNVSAVIAYIKKRNPAHVSLLCTDDRYPENEDYMCALYIQSVLQEQPLDFQKIQSHMRSHPSADGFLRHLTTKWSKRDYYLSMTRDTFDFVVKARKESQIILERI